MSSFTDFFENRLVDSIFRGGCLTTAGAAGSSAVVFGLWTASTAYTAGQIVVPHAGMTGAGGKLLRCTTAGTTGAVTTLAVPNPGSTLTDNTVTWTAIATCPALDQLYMGLFTVAATDAGGGTEVTGGSYTRVTVAATLANWAGTQTAGSTASSTGVGGLTSNNSILTFPAPTANWGVIVSMGIFDSPTAGNLLIQGALTASKTVNSGDAAPTFPIASLTFTLA